jgi:hypothetical protein
VGSNFIEKAFTTLILDVLKLRNFTDIIKDVATVDAYGYVILLRAGSVV